MPSKVVGGLGAAIGCRFLSKRNQLAFVEYSKGAISLVDMVSPTASLVSQGAIVLKGTYVFDCDAGTLNSAAPGDLFWEQFDAVKRAIVPVAGARVVNLGKTNFASITPAVLQTLVYSANPIPGNNDATNQLVDGDVLAVRTNAGNLAKVLVVSYGYDMKIQWVTYKPASPYHQIGTGYANPEDIAVASNEKTAYVTERTGNLLRVDLANANRAQAVVVASGMHAPQQIYLDEAHQQAYTIEYDNPGRLIRIDLATGKQTVLLSTLNNAVGLLVSPDLNDAYISEQSGGGKITRYSLTGGGAQVIASGLTNPFYLTWVQGCESMLVAERDPANRITMVRTIPGAGSVHTVITGTAGRPSSVAFSQPNRVLICCDQEIDSADLLADIAPDNLAKGIGLVPWSLIDTATGLTNTAAQPGYPYQFSQGSPFGGTLSLQVNHLLAWQTGMHYYRILVDKAVRTETWWDLQLNLTTGQYDTLVQFKPKTIGALDGCYDVHPPGVFFYNTDLAMILNSALLANGKRTFKVQFLDAAGNIVSSRTHTQDVMIDNNQCVARIDMPTLAGKLATPQCGVLKVGAPGDVFDLYYTASHPAQFGTWGFWIVKGANTVYSKSGNVSPSPMHYQSTAGAMLANCPAAAFAAQLSVWTMAVNGYGRQSQYDAYCTVAFALM